MLRPYTKREREEEEEESREDSAGVGSTFKSLFGYDEKPTVQTSFDSRIHPRLMQAVSDAARDFLQRVSWAVELAVPGATVYPAGSIRWMIGEKPKEDEWDRADKSYQKHMTTLRLQKKARLAETAPPTTTRTITTEDVVRPPECPICHDELLPGDVNIRKFDCACAARFCRTCAAVWLARSADTTCPCCRQSVTCIFTEDGVLSTPPRQPPSLNATEWRFSGIPRPTPSSFGRPSFPRTPLRTRSRRPVDRLHQRRPDVRRSPAHIETMRRREEHRTNTTESSPDPSASRSTISVTPPMPTLTAFRREVWRGSELSQDHPSEEESSSEPVDEPTAEDRAFINDDDQDEEEEEEEDEEDEPGAYMSDHEGGEHNFNPECEPQVVEDSSDDEASFRLFPVDSSDIIIRPRLPPSPPTRTVRETTTESVTAPPPATVKERVRHIFTCNGKHGGRSHRKIKYRTIHGALNHIAACNREQGYGTKRTGREYSCMRCLHKWDNRGDPETIKAIYQHMRRRHLMLDLTHTETTEPAQ